MMETDNKRIKAEQRVKELKEFYKHLSAYLIVNLAFTFISNYFDVVVRVFDGLRVSNKFTENGFEHYPLWGIWGVILIIDVFRVFGFRKLFGKNWEEEKIKEFINK
ncbi:2TM domain-containing protein [Tenacibaculum sp. MAR_2010_89]|uniref:2TM domain-containing protein n=1 Tax=Tenacibaculum sp. MAR_2010_89 TaxID=1250198 RepID=UPI00089D233B|nr:2TM domain-containing protein [Tenacibaculum sp. MAR_2010_89]SEE44615.1 2TM domain-containing protein [Tenacibaculum sp. MAR_2010_89]